MGIKVRVGEQWKDLKEVYIGSQRKYIDISMMDYIQKILREYGGLEINNLEPLEPYGHKEIEEYAELATPTYDEIMLALEKMFE